MRRIFVSYKSEDRERAGALVEAFAAQGLDVWWDQDIHPSAPWEATIHQALMDAACVIVCWTKRSIDPHAGAKVQVEAREALQNDTLVQVMLEATPPPLFFRQYQAVDLSAWNGRPDHPKFRMLAKGTRAVLDGGRPSVLATSTPELRRGRLWRRFAAVAGTGGLAALVAGTALFPRQARDIVCKAPAMDKLCASEPYDPTVLTPALRSLVADVRKKVERAEEVALRARDAEKAGHGAAAAARTGAAVNSRVHDVPGQHYEGMWANNAANGFGAISWGAGSASVGERFLGEFKDWVMVMGVFIYPPSAANTSEVTRYEGDWQPEPRYPKGNWNGHGVVHYIDGSVYAGEVQHGTKTGLGALTKAKGERVEGRWQWDQLLELEQVTWNAEGQFAPAVKATK